MPRIAAPMSRRGPDQRYDRERDYPRDRDRDWDRRDRDRDRDRERDRDRDRYPDRDRDRDRERDRDRHRAPYRPSDRSSNFDRDRERDRDRDRDWDRDRNRDRDRDRDRPRLSDRDRDRERERQPPPQPLPPPGASPNRFDRRGPPPDLLPPRERTPSASASTSNPLSQPAERAAPVKSDREREKERERDRDRPSLDKAPSSTQVTADRSRDRDRDRERDRAPPALKAVSPAAASPAKPHTHHPPSSHPPRRKVDPVHILPLPTPPRYNQILDPPQVKELRTFHDEYDRLTQEWDKSHQTRMALSYQVFLGEASEGNVPPLATTPAAGSSDTPAPSASAALRQALANLHASEREMETARIRVEQTEAALEDAIVASDRFAKAANLAQASAWGQGIYAAAGLLDGGVAQGSSE